MCGDGVYADTGGHIEQHQVPVINAIRVRFILDYMLKTLKKIRKKEKTSGIEPHTGAHRAASLVFFVDFLFWGPRSR
jgi:hypothetical protein